MVSVDFSLDKVCACAFRWKRCPPAKLVPLHAVKINQQGSYVYVIGADDTVELRPIVVGEEFDGKAVVRKGLNSGERVVIEGHLRLAPGSKVEVKS